MGKRKVSTGPSNKIPKVSIDLPKRLSLDFSESIKTILVEHSTETWNFYFGLLERYADQFDHSVVLPKFQYESFNLGNWVGTQRINYKKGLLTQKKISKLNAIKRWSFAPDTDKFMEFFEIIKKHIKDVDYIPKHSSYNQRKLMSWVSKRRSQYKSGEISQEKIDLLNSLKQWSWIYQGKNRNIWMMHFTYIKEKELWNKSSNYYNKKDGFNVGGFLGEVRKLKRVGNLPKEREELFSSLKYWDWNPGELSAYDLSRPRMSKYIGELKKSAKICEGKNEVIIKIPSDLRRWVNKIRGAYKNGKLPENTVKHFNEIYGWVWDANIATWNKNVERYKNLPYLNESEKKRALKWAEHNEGFYKSGTLVDKQRIKNLKDLGII